MQGVVGRPEAVAVLPQRPAFVAATVAGELEAFGARRGDVRRLLASTGLGDLDPDADPARLSPGEGRRLGLARVLARVEAGARVVLLDEPTAHLDPASASVVLRLVLHLRTRSAVLVASHDPAVAALADRVVPLDGAGPSPIAAVAEPERAPERPQPLRAPQIGRTPVLPVLGAVLAPAASRLALAALLSVLASGFAVALLVLSGWLIVRAAEEPSIALVTVAMVGVRFFGIGRAALRYADRLGVHGAAFRAAGALRMRLWHGLARQGPASRALLTPGATVEALVSDTDRLRDLLPRTVVPLGAGVLVLGGATAAAMLLDPVAGAPAVVLVAAAGVVLPTVAAVLARRTQRGTAALRSAGLRRTASLLAAADDLDANGVAATQVGAAADLAAAADREEARLRRRLGLLRGGVALAVGVTAAATVVIAAGRVAGGAIPGPAVGALALLPLALLPVLDDLVVAATRAARLEPLLAAIAPLLAVAPVDGIGREPGPVHEVALDGLAVSYPGTAPVFSGLSTTARRGRTLAVVGPSGTGKSTLLAALLRHLPPAAGTIALDGTPYSALSVPGVRRRIAWAPQEAHVFDSTLRGNLLLARPGDDRASDEELAAVLRRVGLGPFLATAPAGLDTPVGPAGASLSGGQRQRLAVARALLARADVLLLDEPTAHLDREGADALLADLDAALDDRVRILVTHDPAVAARADAVLDLGQAAARTSRTSRQASSATAPIAPAQASAGWTPSSAAAGAAST